MSGFTVLEVLVVLVISAIVIAAAAPQMRTVILQGARSSAGTDLFSSLNRARSEAIAHNLPTTICQRDGTVTTPQCLASGSGWANGWIVYTNSASETGSSLPADPADIVVVAGPIDQGLGVTVTPAGVTSLQFQSSGRTSQSTTFELCKTGDASFTGRIVSVGVSGHISLYPQSPCP